MSLVSTDPKLTRVLRSLKKRPVIEHKKLTQEIVALHARAPSLSVRGSELARANVRVSADRSRVVQIKLQCLQELIELRNVRESLEDYLSVKYTNFLSQYKSKSARDVVVSEALAPLQRRIRPLQGVIDMAEVVLHDYDQKGRAIYNNGEFLKIGEREV